MVLVPYIGNGSDPVLSTMTRHRTERPLMICPYRILQQIHA
jgi:hypothetical protein